MYSDTRFYTVPPLFEKEGVGGVPSGSRCGGVIKHTLLPDTIFLRYRFYNFINTLSPCILSGVRVFIHNFVMLWINGSFNVAIVPCGTIGEYSVFPIIENSVFIAE